MAQEVRLKSGWLKDDMERASQRVGEWEKTEAVKPRSTPACDTNGNPQDKPKNSDK